MKIQDIKNKSMKWWLGTGSCVLLFLFIAIFGYSKMCFIWQGVKIDAEIKSKENSDLIIVEGVAEKAILLTINGREIFIDKKGNFSEVLSPLPGFSVVSLYAKDKFGKTAEENFKLVRQEKDTEFIAMADNQNTNIKIEADDRDAVSHESLLELEEGTEAQANKDE